MVRFLSTSATPELVAGAAVFAVSHSMIAGLAVGLSGYGLRVWLRRPAWARYTATRDVITNLDARIDVSDPDVCEALIQRSRREAERNRGRDRAQRFRMLLAAAWATTRIHGSEAAGPDVDAMLESLTDAPADAVRYVAGLLVARDRDRAPAPWSEPPPYYRAARTAWVDDPEATAALVRAYVEELEDGGEVELAVSLLRDTLDGMTAAPDRGPYREGPTDTSNLQWSLSVRLAELLTLEGHLGEAWSTLESLRRDDPRRAIEASSIQFNAGHALSACVDLRQAALEAPQNDLRQRALTKLVSLLDEVDAREAARAFRSELGDETSTAAALPDESEARAKLTEALARYGGDHPFITDALAQLAHAQVRAERSAAALASVLQARAIAEAHCGPDHPQLIKLLEVEALVESGPRARQCLARVERLRALHRFDEIEALRP